MLHTDKTAIAFKAICNPGANILKDNVGSKPAIIMYGPLADFTNV